MLQRLVVCLFAAALVTVIAHDDAPFSMPSPPFEVFGGGEVLEGASKFTVGLRREIGSINKCGGSLIARQYVLTAAHCTFSNYAYASIGSHYNNGTVDGEQIKIAKAFVHPQYNASTMAYDVAVLQLERPTKLRNIQPLVLSDRPDFTNPGTWTTVRGWGARENGKFSDVLMEVELQVRETNECKQLLKLADPDNLNPYVVDHTMLCAGGRLGEDSCSGDSGGPLTIWYNHMEVQVGIVSWGLQCGAENTPGVYARISTSRAFIDQYARGHRWEN